MNKFNKIFENLARVNDRSIIWSNWLDYCININLMNTSKTDQDFHGNEEAYLDMFGEWLLQLENDLAYMIIYDVWVAVGGNLFIWIGGMSRIPQTVFEAAKIDGFNPRQEFRHLVLPLMWPTFVTMTTLAVVGMFGSSGSNLLLQTGPNTYSINYWLYQMVLGKGEADYNYGAAAGLFFTLLTIPILVGTRLFLRKHGKAVEF